MLLALMLIHLLQIPSVSSLAAELSMHEEYRELCGFDKGSPERSTFSKFVARAGPETIECVFKELKRSRWASTAARRQGLQ
jgi:hypothetical protein